MIMIFILINLFTNNYKSYGINKTVGWAWDISNYSPIVFLLSFYIFLLVYGITALTKKQTNLTLSLLHMLVISISAFLMEFNNVKELMILNYLSVVFFILNFLWIISNSEKTKSAPNTR